MRLRSRHLRGDPPRGPAAPGGSGVLDVGLPDGRPGRVAWLLFRPHAAAPDTDGAPGDRERVGVAETSTIGHAQLVAFGP